MVRTSKSLGSAGPCRRRELVRTGGREPNPSEFGIPSSENKQRRAERRKPPDAVKIGRLTPLRSPLLVPCGLRRSARSCPFHVNSTSAPLGSRRGGRTSGQV